MAKTSYYDEVRDMARDGATIVDLGCGFGQELRRLRADGATGELYGVDLREDMWSFGLRLLNDWDDKEWAGQFRKADIISRYDNENPLAEFADKTDVFLLNDVVSFWGPNISGVLDSIDMVSRVGTKVIGWMIGQEGDENLNGMQVYGDGLLRGCIPTMSVFKALFSMSNVHPDIKWNIEARLVEFEKLGFDEEDQEWFTSEFLILHLVLQERRTS
jgi:SAM-dependent methyltransferase